MTNNITLQAWFELSRVKLYRNDLRGNENYFELAGGSSYRGFELPRVKKTLSRFRRHLDEYRTSRQTREKLQCLYENLMSNNFRKTAVLKKKSVVN